MKKTILLVAFATIPFISGAQDVVDTMAQEVCKCLEEKKLLTINDIQQLTTEAGVCIVESYSEHQEEVSAQLGISEFNDETGRTLGQKIGLKMMKYCPDYLMKMGMVAKENTAKTTPATYVLNGKIDAIEQGEFISYKLKDQDGKIHKLLWYQHFKGSDDYIESPKKLVGKKVNVTVKDVECYIPKAKGYYSIKEIVELNME